MSWTPAMKIIISLDNKELWLSTRSSLQLFGNLIKVIKSCIMSFFWLWFFMISIPDVMVQCSWKDTRHWTLRTISGFVPHLSKYLNIWFNGILYHTVLYCTVIHYCTALHCMLHYVINIIWYIALQCSGYIWRKFSLAVPSSFHLDEIMLAYDKSSQKDKLGVWWFVSNLKNKIYKQNWQNKQWNDCWRQINGDY